MVCLLTKGVLLCFDNDESVGRVSVNLSPFSCGVTFLIDRPGGTLEYN